MADVLVLCYHAVDDQWPMAVPAAALEAQITHLLERGYRPASFTEAVLDPPAPRTLAVTFDDGLRSVREHALPLLSRLGVAATAFVPTAFPGRPRAEWPGLERWLASEHEHGLAPMSWEQVSELADAGWEIGSHTRTHPRLTRLGDAELAEELHRSRSECEERLGQVCRSLAYPYGDVDGRVVAAAGAAGYEAGAGLPVRLRRATALNWPRVGVYANDPLPRFRAKTAPLRRHLIGWDGGEWIVRRTGGRSRAPV